MADYFVSRLPAGHAIKDIQKSAATNTVRSEQMIIAAPETTLTLLRRQCAAVVWVRSDTYSFENLEKLPGSERAYLLKLFGLASGGTVKAQAKRIDDHVLIYPAAAGPQAPNAGGAGGGAGGGVPPPPQPAAGGLVLALLSQEQATILSRLSRPDMYRLLKAAGVPAGDGETIDSVRDKCAAAAWAAEQLRRPSDVRSLPGSLPALVATAFSIPDGWLQEAQDQALSAILDMCRHSSWALDPTSSLGLVSPTRSAIFRAAESVAYPARQSLFAQAGTHLSTQETSKVESLLALSGHSVSDLVFSEGKWTVRGSDGGSGGQATSAGLISGSIATTTLEDQIRTLHVEPYTLLTPEERKDQANRSKATPGKKRQAAFPGDVETEIADGSLNPLAEWPWEQPLPLRKSDSYSLSGRIVRNALHWCNRHFTDALMQVTFRSHQEEQARIYKRFTDAVEAGRPDRALLCAHQAISEAREEMKAIVTNAQLFASQHPNSAMMAHIAARRKVQESELSIYLADLSQRVNDAAQKTTDSATQHATAAFIDFLDGWMNKTDVAQIRPESLQQAATLTATATPAPQPTTQGTTTSGASGGTPANKTARTTASSSASAGGSGGSSGGGGKGAAQTLRGASPGKSLGKMCVIQQNIPCSPHVIGNALGVAGAPPCRICGLGAHFHGECPQAWGSLGINLPGHQADGSRTAGEWNKNEPIQKTVKAWVKFLSDPSNFNGSRPSPAGVPGAPTLAKFQARVSTAPVKP